MDGMGILEIYEDRKIVVAGLSYQEKVLQFLRASMVSEARRAYTSSLKRFFAWCQAEDASTVFPTSPVVLAAYVASLAESGAASATVERTLAAVAAAHRAEGIPSLTDSLLVKKFEKKFRPREVGWVWFWGMTK